MTAILAQPLSPNRLPILVPGIEQQSRVFPSDRAAIPEVMAFVHVAFESWGIDCLERRASHAVPALASWILEHDRCPLGFVVTVWTDRPLVFVDLVDRGTSLPNIDGEPGLEDRDLYLDVAPFAEDWGAELTPTSRCVWLSFAA